MKKIIAIFVLLGAMANAMASAPLNPPIYNIIQVANKTAYTICIYGQKVANSKTCVKAYSVIYLDDKKFAPEGDKISIVAQDIPSAGYVPLGYVGINIRNSSPFASFQVVDNALIAVWLNLNHPATINIVPRGNRSK